MSRPHSQRRPAGLRGPWALLRGLVLGFALGGAIGAGPAMGEGCPPPPEPVTSAEVTAGLSAARDAGLLWRISRGGHDSYLFGTLHAARREWMFPGPAAMRALRASERVLLELDPSDPDTLERMQRAVAARPGAPALAPDLAARLAAQARAACLPVQALAGLRPEMQTVTLAVLSARRLGLQPAYGLDATIATLARGLGKPVQALETPEAQAAVLVSDDPARTARVVRESLEELESGEASRVLFRLADDWHRGDLDDLSAYRRWCDCVKTAEQADDLRRMVEERNGPMAERVAAAHARGAALFVAVGSLHLVGPGGLPELLRRRGFRIERIAGQP